MSEHSIFIAPSSNMRRRDLQSPRRAPQCYPLALPRGFVDFPRDLALRLRERVINTLAEADYDDTSKEGSEEGAS